MSYAMNTIPTTFNEHVVPYTLAGGSAFKSKGGGVDAVIMSRAGWYNFSFTVQQLLKLGCTSIISVELPNKSLDLERMSSEHPYVKFLVPSQEITRGEGINLAMSELKGEWVIVLWNEQMIVDEKMLLKALGFANTAKKICVAPILISKSNELLHTQMVPVLKEGHFYTESLPTLQNNLQTIYPFDFSGIYNRRKFIETAGFDYTISNPYWQNLDFGFRSYLWGDEIRLCTHFKLKYLAALPTEETSHDDSYTRFYLKNLRPTVKNGIARMNFDVFFSYMKSMGANPLKAYQYFRIGKKWVSSCEKRFKTTPYDLISNWRATQ